MYTDSCDARNAEIKEAIHRNLENKYIEQIHIFNENLERKTYLNFFQFTNEKLSGSVVVLANNDIYFDDTLGLLVEGDLDGKLLCITRRDGGNLHPCPYHSQDAWILKAPLKSFPCDWQLGRMRCDNKLVYEARKAGLKVFNPCLDIHIHHLHASRKRNYSISEVLPGEVDTVNACSLEEMRKSA
jgi:hypothetical protein